MLRLGASSRVISSTSRWILKRSSSSVDAMEMERFAKTAKEWFNVDGPYELLHRMNSLRTNYIRNQLTPSLKEDAGFDMARPFSRLNILDIGCGGGFLSQSLARLGASVTGVDANYENIQVAKQYKRHPIKFLHSTAEELLEQGQKFDVVCALEIVEHVVDPKEFVKTCVNLPDGYIFMSTINRSALSYFGTIALAENVLGWVPKGTHTFEKYVTPTELRSFLSSANTQVIDTTGMAYNPITKLWSLETCSSPQMNYIVTAIKTS